MAAEDDAPKRQDMTTVRANVTDAEHEAIRRCAKKLGMNLNELVRAAVWDYVECARGATVEQLIETAAGEPYQPMLFNI